MEDTKEKMKKENEFNEEKLLKDIAKYLESKGWKAAVISFKGISPRELKYNYSLIINFTGKKVNGILPQPKG